MFPRKQPLHNRRCCIQNNDLVSQVEIYELEHVSLSRRTRNFIQVVVDRRKDFGLLNRAAVVCVVPVTDNAARGRGGIHRIGRYRILSLAGALSVGVTGRGPKVVAFVGSSRGVGGVRGLSDVGPC